jgi:hypothetical protein
MRPEPGQVLHFSEDPSIARFEPHVAPTSTLRDPLVWAVDAARSPGYWFPRACPRAMAWASSSGRAAASACTPSSRFTPIGEPEPHALVCAEPVEPLGSPEPVGSLLRLHDEAGIQLRVLPGLWPFWDAVVASTLGYSGIRLRNARPRPAP